MPTTVRTYKPGQVLFEEGSASTSLFLIKKGAISIRKKKGTAYIEVAKVQANEVLGELSFFDRRPRSATAVAINDVSATEITFDSMEKIYNQIPDYLKTIVASLAGRLRKANDQIRQLQKKERPGTDPESNDE